MPTNFSGQTALVGITNQEYIDSLFTAYAANYAVVAPRTRINEMGEGKGKTWSVPIIAADTAADITEGSDFSETEFGISNVDIAAGVVGLNYPVTAETQHTNMFGAEVMDLIAQTGSKFCLDLIEKDLCTLASSASVQVGSTGTDLTFAVWMTGLYALEVALAKGKAVFGGHMIQVSDLRSSLSTGTGAVLGNSSFGIGPAAGSGDLSQYHGELMGASIVSSSHFPAANTDADRVGMFFIDGKRSPEFAAFGLNVCWWPRVRFVADPDSPATNAQITTMYGEGEIKDAYYVGVLSDHE